MLNLTQNTNLVADNTVVLNGGQMQFNLTDAQMTELVKFLRQMGQGVSSVASPVSTPVAEKKEYSYKDTDPKWSVEKIDNLFCIKSGVYFKMRTAKAVANGYIKAIDGVKTIDVKRADGKGSYKAWGFKTKKAAEEAVAKLPKVLTADELNKKQAELKAQGR